MKNIIIIVLGVIATTNVWAINCQTVCNSHNMIVKQIIVTEKQQLVTITKDDLDRVKTMNYENKLNTQCVCERSTLPAEKERK
jgi:hypothetical protein